MIATRRSRSMQSLIQSVIGRSVVYFSSRKPLREGYFAYLREDLDDEYKKQHPIDILKPPDLIRSETLADKIALEDELRMQRRQKAYSRINKPQKSEDARWSNWMTVRDPRKKEKFDTSYSSGKFYASMNLESGGTIPEEAESAIDPEPESAVVISELGKGSSPSKRMLGDKLEVDALMQKRNDQLAESVDQNHLPGLNLGRQYDTGLRFDRTRPTLRKDRYVNAWSRPEFQPVERPDGSMDTRPMLEFDVGKTEAVEYLGGERYEQEQSSSTGTYAHPAEASKTVASEEMMPDVESRTDVTQSLGSTTPGFHFMKDWREVYDAFRNLKSSDKAQEISQALFALKQLSPHPPSNVLREIVDEAIKHCYAMMPISLTNVIHSCAKMRFYHPSLLQAWQERLQEPRVLEGCTDLDVTTLIYSLGVLNRLGASEWKRGSEKPIALTFRFIDTIATEAVHPVRMNNYNPSMVVNIFYGLSLLQFNKSETLNKLLDVISRPDVLQRLETHNISAAIHSLGNMRFWAPDATKKLLTELYSRIESLPSSGIGAVMWALGNLRYPDLDIVSKFSRVAVQEKHLRNYNEQGLASVLYGMAMCRFRDPAVIGEAITEIMRPGRVTITHLISSFSSLRYSDRQLFQMLLTEISSPKRVKGLRNMHVANVFYALGACHYDNPSAIEPLMDEAIDPDRLPSFSNFDIATIFYATGQLMISPGRFVSSITTEVMKEERLVKYSTLHLANIINALASLKCGNENYLATLCQELAKEERLENITPGGITRCTVSLCRLQFYNATFFSAYLKKCVDPEMITVIRPNTLIDLLFGCVRADVVHFTRFLSVIKLLREPRRIESLPNFSFVRVISVAAILGLGDQEFLKTVKNELLKEGRKRSLTVTEIREIARSFERLGYFDDELCALLNYGKRVKGESIGILAPGGVQQAVQDEREQKLEKQREESNLDWTGRMRPTFYSS